MSFWSRRWNSVSRFKACSFDSLVVAHLPSSSHLFTLEKKHLQINSLSIQRWLLFHQEYLQTNQPKMILGVQKHDSGTKKTPTKTNQVGGAPKCWEKSIRLIRPFFGQRSLCQKLTCQWQKVLGMCPGLFLSFFSRETFQNRNFKMGRGSPKMPWFVCPHFKKRHEFITR